MTECSKNVLSKCLNPTPVQVGSWKSMAKSTLNGVVDGGKEIFLGAVVDSFWSVVNTPDHIFKYIAGVDKNLGQGNQWSWSNFGKHYSLKTIDGNPIFRTFDVPVYGALGILNTVTVGIPQRICNDRLALCTKYFPAPPNTLRESAHWGVMGIFGLAAFSAPVLAARGGAVSAVVSKSAPIKPAIATKATPIGAQPSFAASVSEIGTTNGVQVPPALVSEAFRSPRLPRVIVPEEPVVVEPVVHKTPPALTPELAPPLRHALPQVFEPHQIAAQAVSATEALESAFWTFLRGTQRTLEILEQEKLPVKILAEDKIYHAKLARDLKASSKVQEALDRVKQKKLEKEKLTKK